ncbi:protein spire homolog 2 [Engraulis encrasicolus]|uniref:protein spire homolog 2 n=1 Tax=Engraulis encrasicolus TaxID=184585 RepID=UPI002FD193F4
MAKAGSRCAPDGESRVATAPSDRGEARDFAEPRELSLEEVLKSYEQPINEEQAWAVCYQCCSWLRVPRLNRTEDRTVYQVKNPSSIFLHRDGTVSLHSEPWNSNDDTGALSYPPVAESQLVQSLGVAIYKALDWGLDDSEERELSPQLEQLIDRMVGGAESGEAGSEAGGSGVADEGYSGQEGEEEDEEEEEEVLGEGGGDGTAACAVRTFRQVMALCATRLANPGLAPEHYQAVCRALFVETLELQTFLTKIRDAKEMLKKIRKEESKEDRSVAELDDLKHTDWARLWVQLMKELRQGVKLKKVEEQPFNPLATEFSLTPFEMLMQDIRSRKYKLRKVMVDGDIPTTVKRNAHELILEFIRSRPPLKPASERSMPPPPQHQPSLHERVLEEIRQERKLRPVDPPNSKRAFGSLPCLAHTCSCDIKSTSCIDLSMTDAGPRPPSRPRVLLKAPTLQEMEEMNIFEEEDSPCSAEIRRVESSPTPLKRDRSFSEHDLAELRGEMLPSLSGSGHLGIPEGVTMRERPRANTLTGAWPVPTYRASFPVAGWMSSSPARCSLSSVEEASEGVSSSVSPSPGASKRQWMEEFSHPVESLALTVDEVINVRRVLVKAEMEKFLQNKELYNNLRKGKVCCCCRVKFPLFSWPSTCLLCKRSVCGSCSAKMKIPSKKLAHIPVYTVGFHNSPRSQHRKSEVYKSLRTLSRRSVEEEFPHLYAHGCSLRDVCAECTKFVADVISSSRRSLDILNNTPKREKPSSHTSSCTTSSYYSSSSSSSSTTQQTQMQTQNQQPAPQAQTQAQTQANPHPQTPSTPSRGKIK